MKRILYLVAALISTFLTTALVFAVQVPTATVLYCSVIDPEEISINTDKPGTDTPVTCDLAIKKQVSINEVDFFDANSTDTAPKANIGDTVTYKITVTDVTPPAYAISSGTIVVNDILPSGLVFVDALLNAGTYTGGTWTYAYQNSATLTVKAKVTLGTTMANTAILNTKIDQDSVNCDGLCFTDMNNGNNIDSAYLVINPLPQVLGATSATLSDTGSSTIYQTILAVGITLFTMYVALKKNKTPQ